MWKIEYQILHIRELGIRRCKNPEMQLAYEKCRYQKTQKVK